MKQTSHKEVKSKSEMRTLTLHTEGSVLISQNVLASMTTVIYSGFLGDGGNRITELASR